MIDFNELEKRFTSKRNEAIQEHTKRIPIEKRSLLYRIGIPENIASRIDLLSVETPATEATKQDFAILVLGGKAGTGKTVAAVLWIKSFIDYDVNWSEPGKAITFKGQVPVWVTSAKLSRWERYEQESMSKLLYTPRLVIDDLGAEYLDKNGFYISLLDEVINERYAASRKTIITTNLDGPTFATKYGDRIAGRIRESGIFFGCGSVDMRKGKS